MLHAQLLPAMSFAGNNNGNELLAASQASFKRLEGKVAIVTGGARGIGEATVRLFAAHGAKVIIADVEDSLGNLVASSLSPHDVTYAHCDVTSEQDIETLVNDAVSNHGKLDVFFSNAGVLGDQSKHKSILDFDADEFEQVMRVNVRGTALGMKHAARAMINGGGGGGCIICTASVAGVMGGLGPHAYTASKHAVVGLVKNAACELGRHGIRVNCISPFGVATRMLVTAWRKDGEEGGAAAAAAVSEEEVEKTEEFVRGLGNLKGVTLRARDVAEAVVFLSSDESRYISGHNLVVDGGVTTFKNFVNL
ncbi:hypothetical protein ACP275_10G008800 [Erythranthe tilingii]